MEVILQGRTSDVELGLRGDVVNVARGYARNFLLPRGLAETATPALVRELQKRDAQRARHEAQEDRRSPGDRRPARRARAPVRRQRRPHGLAVRLRDGDERGRPHLGARRRSAIDRRKLADGHDQADRALHGAARAVRRRARPSCARGCAGGPGAAERGRARGARGRRAGGRGRGGSSGRGPEGAAVRAGRSAPEPSEAPRRPASERRTGARRGHRPRPSRSPPSRSGEPAD